MSVTTKCYHFYTTTDSDNWANIKAHAKSLGHDLDATRSIGPHLIPSRTDEEIVTLDDKLFFSDQWNEEGDDGRRLFDAVCWYLPRRGKEVGGQYLEITDEMKTLRHDTGLCGWCGARLPYEKGLVHKDCWGGPHLTLDKLYLTQVIRIDEDNREARSRVRKEFTLEQIEVFKEEYLERQLTSKHAAEKRAYEKLRDDLNKELVKVGQEAVRLENQKDAILWMLDSGLSIRPIRYAHALKDAKSPDFGFGWDGKLDDAVAERLVAALDNPDNPFPARYRIKTVTKEITNYELP